MSKGEASSSQRTMDYQLRGPMRGHYLQKCLDRIKSWGLTMPTVEVLLLDFGLKEFERTGLAEFWVANEVRAGYCGKFLFVFDGQTCPTHLHHVKKETFFVVKGAVEMVSGGTRRPLKEGDVHVVEPGTAHSFTGRGDALLLEVSMPCMLRDSIFADMRIGADGVI